MPGLHDLVNVMLRAYAPHRGAPDLTAVSLAERPTEGDQHLLAQCAALARNVPSLRSFPATLPNFTELGSAHGRIGHGVVQAPVCIPVALNGKI